MAERLTERGFEVVEADSGERALELLDQFAFDIVITDLRLPGIDGSRVIEAARERYPGIVAIVITGFGTVKDAVDAIKRGASDFIAKPFQFDELIHVLQKAMEQRRLTTENAYLRSQLEERHQFGNILGHSRPMQKLFHLLETVARSNSTILITGETGTGKEVVARAIHHNGPRKRSASSRSTAVRFRRRSSKRSCLATCEVRLPARSARVRDDSNRRTRARCSSTKWAR